MDSLLLRRLCRLLLAAWLLAAVAGAADVSLFPWKSIEVIPSPAGPGSAQPHLAASPDGTVVLSWLEPVGGGHALRYSRLDGETWSEPVEIARGEDWFVNWADFPSVVPITDEVWAAHWLAKSADATYAYDVMLSVSDDAGETWSAPFSPHTDGTPTEHGFVTLFPWQEAIGAVWLDGRNMTGGHGDHGGSGMTLRSALVSPRGELLEGHLIDGLVCDCCQTDAVATQDGPLVVYRNRTEDEIRDIQAVRADGDGWGEPIAVHEDGWKIAGCPVNGPAVSTDGKQVDVAWFTAAEDPEVRFARSFDGGATWTEPATIEGRLGQEKPPWGRVDVVTLDDGSSLVSWVTHAGAGRGKVAMAWVSSDGRVSADRAMLPDAEPSRQVGFPQIVRDGDDLMVAWTAAEGDDSHRVRTVRVSERR